MTKWESYHSSEPPLVVQRLERLLSPPPTVKLELEAGTLQMTGAASHVWITRSVPLAYSVPGVVQVDTTQLIDLDAQRLAELTRDVQQYVVRFEGGASAMIDAKDDLQPLAESIKSLLSASVAAERQVEIRIVGHAAKRGSDEFQQELSEMRAEVVRTALAARGIPAERLTASAAGATQPARTGGTTEDLAANRRVTFQITSESKP
jgi:OOP family OmpA-OmpF porin